MTPSDLTFVPAADLRCATCSARRSPEATWCSQCYTRFEPAAVEAAVEPAAVEPGAVEPGVVEFGKVVRSGAPVTDSEPSAARQTSAGHLAGGRPGRPEDLSNISAQRSAWDERYQQVAREIDEETRSARVQEAMAALSASDDSLPPVARELVRFTATPVGKLLLIASSGAVLLGLGLAGMFLAGRLL